MKEIKRIENIGETGMTVGCLKCGKEFPLFFNGGELDKHECCGLKYELVHRQIDFVVAKIDTAKANLSE